MKKGFTLIELLVVVLIIGILAAVALPQYTKAVEKSRTAEAMQMLGDIATAEQIYYMSTNGYTIDLTALDLSFPGGTAEGTVSTNSYNISVKLNTTKENVSIEAKRKDGAYANQTIILQLDNKGKIDRGFGEANSDIAKLAPTWAPATTTLSHPGGA